METHKQPTQDAHHDLLPRAGKLYADRAFVGLLATQFLGAFNDNVFKQTLLLMCLDYKKAQQLPEDRFQPIATALFTVAFLMFSGLAGYLSDKYRKRRIVVLSKVAEIVIMVVGLLVMLSFPPGSLALLWALIGVLFVMGTQSAFFGPSKYGVLPEILHEDDLPVANGWIQMTTFLAIILGIVVAGKMKQQVGGDLWMICVACIVIACLGTLSSLFLRNPGAAQRELRFSPSCLAIEKNAWGLLQRDRPLLVTMIVYSMFWFVGGVILPTVNEVGKSQLGWNDEVTSNVNACMAVGIGIGCLVAGNICRRSNALGLVRVGSAGLAAALCLASVAAVFSPAAVNTYALGGTLLIAGIFGGILAVPLQVFLQARPPVELKGRTIGAMNLITWIGVLAAAAYYFLFNWAFSRSGIAPSWILATLAVVMLVVAFGYRTSGPTWHAPPRAP